MGWRARVGWCLGIACACSPAANQAPATAAPRLGSPTAARDGCVDDAGRRAERIAVLTAEGRLDEAWQLALPEACPSGAAVLDEARLTLLAQMEYGAELRIVAKRVAARSGGSAEKIQLARELLAAPVREVDERALAEELAQRGLSATSTERRRALDAALLAYERASGEAPRALALGALAVGAVIDPTTVIASAIAEPDGTAHAVVVRLTKASGRAVRLLGSGEYAPATYAGSSGRLVVDYAGRGLAYASLTAQPELLPAADRYALLSDAVVMADAKSVSVRASIDDPRVTDRQAVSLSSAALAGATTTADGRFWIACPAGGIEPGGAVVVDGRAGRVTVNLGRVISCAADLAREQLVVVRAKSPTGPFVAQVLALRGGDDVSIPLPGVKGPDEVSVYVDARRPSASVVTKGRTRFIDLEKRRLVTSPPPAKPVGPARLRAVSVGHMGSSRAAISPLRALARPPRHVVEPSFVTIHAWTENAALSFDGDTVAAYTVGKTDANVLLVIADAKTLKVRHRIDVHYGLNWLTAFFLNNRFLVAQSYPSYQVYDVTSGEHVASPEDAEMKVVLDRFLVSDSRIWDLSPGVSQRLVDLGLAQDARFTGKRPERELSPREAGAGRLRFTADGHVTLAQMAAPSFLYCAFGEWLAPWAVCERRLSQ